MHSSGKRIIIVLQTMRMLHLLSRPEARTISGVNQIPGQPRKQQTLIKGRFLKILQTRKRAGGLTNQNKSILVQTKRRTSSIRTVFVVVEKAIV
jgi:hypothetical protein